MTSHSYRHSIRFRSGAHSDAKYQLQISELNNNGQLIYRAQWDFPTLRNLLLFLKKHFPHSQALDTSMSQPISFERLVAIASC